MTNQNSAIATESIENRYDVVILGKSANGVEQWCVFDRKMNDFIDATWSSKGAAQAWITRELKDAV